MEESCVLRSKNPSEAVICDSSFALLRQPPSPTNRIFFSPLPDPLNRYSKTFNPRNIRYGTTTQEDSGQTKARVSLEHGNCNDSLRSTIFFAA